MGFSAYILESLKRYGKAEIGSFGVFILDYQPAHWNIAYQYFTPPQAKITWSPANHNAANLDLLASTVSRMHEIPRNQSLEFVQETMDKINIEFRQHQKIDLGILGSFSTGSVEGEILFIPNPDLTGYLEYSGLTIKPLLPQLKSEGIPSWLISFLIAGLTLAFFWILFGVIQPEARQAASIKSEILLDQQMKGVNLAPSYPDTVMHQPDSDFGSPLMEPKIIITGTFCKPANILKMKEKIEYLQYQLYEEFIDDHCVRIGIYLHTGDDLESSLADIRKYIEPGAWILD